MKALATVIASLALVLFCTVVQAQSVTADVVVEDPAENTWEQVATRAEAVLVNNVASLFSLTRLRAELFEWRDIFSARRAENAGRINTVTNQILALGDAPTDGDEPAEISARRADLQTQLDTLRVPVLLAEESFARADGLIDEVDTQIRARDAANLTERGTPLVTPALWAPAGAGLIASVRTLATDLQSGVRVAALNGSLWRSAPTALLFLAMAFVLLTRGRKWAMELAGSTSDGPSAGRSVWVFLVSTWEFILPAVGLLAVAVALRRLDILGRGGDTVMEAAVIGGLAIFFARWLALRFFPVATMGPLNQSIEANAPLRRNATLLGWGLAVLYVVSQLLTLVEMTASQMALIAFPIQVVLSFVLFSFGRKLRQPPEPGSASRTTGRVRNIVGLVAMGIALLAPILAIFGFAAASDGLFGPAVVTLAILGVVILLQRFVHDVWLIWTDPETGDGALAPVLIGFCLFLLSLPILALVWGARVTDMSEIWARFKEGFQIGETTLSPTDFLIFVVVFAVGYLITRLTQSGLKQSVLPRTKIDIGGQNAIVAGVGYVGIILAAIAAITYAGVDLSSIALVAGALSVGIGFGLQTVVSNFVSGIILLIERPVSEGDWIEVNGNMGIVRDISVRSTRIETFDRTDVIVPNADLISGQVTNWTHGNSVGRVIVPVGVAYGTDVGRVHDILLEIAKAHPMVLLDPEPAIIFQNFGDNSLDFEIRAILRDVNFVLSVKSELNTEIAKRFAQENIEIPFPQRDVWMRTPEG